MERSSGKSRIVLSDRDALAITKHAENPKVQINSRDNCFNSRRKNIGTKQESDNYENQQIHYSRAETGINFHLDKEQLRTFEKIKPSVSKKCLREAHGANKPEKCSRIKRRIPKNGRHKSLKQNAPLDKEAFNIVFPSKNSKNFDTGRYKEISPMNLEMQHENVIFTDRIQRSFAKNTLAKLGTEQIDFKRPPSRGHKRSTAINEIGGNLPTKRSQKSTVSKKIRGNNRRTSAKASTQDSEKAIKRYRSQASHTKNGSIVKSKDYRMTDRPPSTSININSKAEEIYSIFSSNLLNFENRIRGSTSGEKSRSKRSSQKLLLESLNDEPVTNKSMHNGSKIRKLPHIFVTATPVKRKIYESTQSKDVGGGFLLPFDVSTLPKTKGCKLPSLKNPKKEFDKEINTISKKIAKNVPRSLFRPRYNLTTESKSTEEVLKQGMNQESMRLETSVGKETQELSQERLGNDSNQNISGVGSFLQKFQTSGHMSNGKGRIDHQAPNLSRSSTTHILQTLALRDFSTGYNLIEDLKSCLDSKMSKTPANFGTTVERLMQNDFSSCLESTQKKYSPQKYGHGHQKSIILCNTKKCLSQECENLLEKEAKTGLAQSRSQNSKGHHIIQSKVFKDSDVQNSRDKEFEKT